MKKRVYLILVAVFLCLSVVLGSSRSALAKENVKKGDKISGFTVKNIDYDAPTSSTEILFEHEKTGAKLLVIQNNDINRGFAIKFNTIAENDKGINHIIEHSVLGGSKKYPSKNILFDVSNTTYNSFVNAFTYKNMTVYPICSKSEEQLLKSADIYLDSVFNPLLLSDKRIFEREGLRLELKDESSDLIYNGIVYNEMQGSLGSIESAAVSNASKAIFPNSHQGNISGGDPDAIRTLTYEEVLKTYKKNYHPSNCLIVLYGDLEYKAFLKMIDKDYLSSYNKKNYKTDRGTQKAFKKLAEKTYSFPAAKGTDSNKAVIDLVFACSDSKKMGFEDYVGLNIAISLLNLDNSDLKKALMDSKIAESYSIGIDTTTYQPTIHFIAQNADASKKKEFYNIIVKELKAVVKKGFDTDLVRSSLRTMEFEQALGSTEGSAVNAIIQACLYDDIFGDSQIDYSSYYEKIVSKLDKKVLEKIVDKYLVKNNFAALTVTEAKPGLLEKNQKALEESLAKMKASMSKKEIKALVKKTKDFNTWNNQETPDNILKSLRAVSLKDITSEIKEREIKETTVGGVKLVTAMADIPSVSAIRMNFNLSHLTMEELLYLKFYSDMLSYGMATKNRTEGQILSESTEKLYSGLPSVGAIMEDDKDTKAYPVITFSYYGFKNEYKDTFDLVSDILLNSDIENITTYGSRTISNLKSYYQYMFAEPLSLAAYRALAYTSQTYRYYNYLDGLDYYNFIQKLEKNLASNPDEVVKKLSEVRTKAFTKNNLDVLFVGGSNAQAAFQDAMPDFTSKLPDEKYEKVTHNLPVPSKREALTNNSTVQYVISNSSMSENGVPTSAKINVITSILNNLMLTPEIRLKGGAYGVTAFAENDNYVTYTYRDSNYVNSLAVIGGTDEFLLNTQSFMTEDALESYKMTAYAAASPSSNEITDAMVALQSYYLGISLQDRLNVLNEIKDTSLADISTYADYMEKINGNSNYVVVASPSEIEKNKSMFDKVIPLQ